MVVMSACTTVMVSDHDQFYRLVGDQIVTRYHNYFDPAVKYWRRHASTPHGITAAPAATC